MYKGIFILLLHSLQEELLYINTSMLQPLVDSVTVCFWSQRCICLFKTQVGELLLLFLCFFFNVSLAFLAICFLLSSAFVSNDVNWQHFWHCSVCLFCNLLMEMKLVWIHLKTINSMRNINIRNSVLNLEKRNNDQTCFPELDYCKWKHLKKTLDHLFRSHAGFFCNGEPLWVNPWNDENTELLPNISGNKIL